MYSSIEKSNKFAIVNVPSDSIPQAVAVSGRDVEAGAVVAVVVADVSVSLPSAVLGVTTRETRPSVSCSIVACSFFGGAVFGGGMGAAGAALSGLVGAKILNAAGLDEYQADLAVKAGAAGAALLFSVYGGLRIALMVAGSATNSERKHDKLGDIILSAGLSALSGVLGALMLGEDDMTLGQFAAAGALGSAVGSLGVYALTSCCTPNTNH